VNPDAPGDLIAALTELCLVTERQIAAAIELDGRTLQALQSERVALLYAIETHKSRGFPDADRPKVRSLAERLQTLELRLATVSRVVVEVLDRSVPRRPLPRYGRSGLLLP
jgi:hypothetical protein